MRELIRRVLREESKSSVKKYLFKYWDKNGTSIDVGKYFSLSEFETAQYLFEYRNYDFDGVKEQVKTLIENYHECDGDEFSLRFNNIDFVRHKGGHGDIDEWISYNVYVSIKSDSPIFRALNISDPEDAKSVYGEIEDCVTDMLNGTIYFNYGIAAHHCYILSIYE
jgi:hypothetical protein